MTSSWKLCCFVFVVRQFNLLPLKKKAEAKEQQLIKDIKAIEESVSGFSTDILSDKKVELENLRSIKMKGKIVHSRLQWLQQGKKPFL